MTSTNNFDFNSSDRIPNLSGEVSPASISPVHGSGGEREEADHTAAGGTKPAPVVDAHGRVLNPRSCVTCRRRKVKCDKSHPCSNCTKAHIECVFPGPGRAPRKPRKHAESRDSELLARLRRLEGVVKTLGVEVPPDGLVRPTSAARDRQTSTHAATDSSGEHAHHNNLITRSSAAPSTPSSANGSETAQGGFESKFGRLVVDDGRSRYVNTSFWANLNEEVEDLKEILGDDTDETDSGGPNPLPGQGAGNHQGWMFQFSSLAVDLLSLHPPPNQFAIYWNIYRDRVDPVVKLLHLPSITPTILAAPSRLDRLSKGFEALLFAIYYATVTSLPAKECKAIMNEERQVLLSRYRFGLEQALARANFLTAAETVVLQAMVLFLMCLRRNSSARIIWTLTGLLVRMSQTMGIHRDGSHFHLPPFEIEMRRRLWWQICILDVRASEDHGCDPTITENSFDTRMPGNFNDTDIAPNMPEMPEERVGTTDMSFCLIRFEVANIFRKLNYSPPGQKGPGEDWTEVSLQQKGEWIQETHDMLEEKYLKHCDMGVPLSWVTATVTRLIMAKLWLIVYHPLQRNDVANDLTDEIRNKLFITSLEALEYGTLLATETRTMKWAWMFKTYMQWHALALLLTELCRRTRGPLVDRAWKVVGEVHGILQDMNNRGGAILLWRPISKLMAKASHERQKALDEDASSAAVAAAAAADQTSKFEASKGDNLAPGSVAHLLHNMRRDNSSSIASPASRGSLDSGREFSSPAYGSLMQDTFNPSTAFAPPKASPSSQTQLPKGNLFGANPQSGSPTSFVNTSVPSDAVGLAGQTTAMPGLPDWTPTVGRTGTMDSNMSFGGDNPNNFNLANLPTKNAAGDMSMTFDANGELDWANWDTMVRQFGMDIDSTGETGTNEPQNWNTPGWSGLVNGMMTPGLNGPLAGQMDWF